jgi:hypothetical protein
MPVIGRPEPSPLVDLLSIEEMLKKQDARPSYDKAPPHPLLQFFQYNHLPENLRPTSKLFHDLAHSLDEFLPTNSEKTTALRKLLEAKDCAVRALIYK